MRVGIVQFTLFVACAAVVEATRFLLYVCSRTRFEKDPVMASVTAMPVTGFSDDPMRSQTMTASFYYDPAVYEREKAAVF